MRLALPRLLTLLGVLALALPGAAAERQGRAPQTSPHGYGPLGNRIDSQRLSPAKTTDYTTNALNQVARTSKRVWTWDNVNAEWDLALHRKFVHDGWLLLLELDGLDDDAAVA